MQAGDMVGAYRLRERVGRGSTGEVFRADGPGGAAVAVKVCGGAGAAADDARRGAAAARGLRHPGIVAILDVIEDSGRTAVVAEFLPGGSLRDSLRSGPWPEREAYACLLEVLEALDAAHRGGLVHGDLKPENVVFREGGRPPRGPVLVDLGAAAPLEAERALVPSWGPHEAPLCGSPGYSAPELIEGAAPDRLSDVFSVGVIAFEMLTGVRPCGPEVPSALAALAFPAVVDEWYRRACARRERRFASAAAAARGLAHLAAALARPEGRAALPPGLRIVAPALPGAGVLVRVESGPLALPVERRPRPAGSPSRPGRACRRAPCRSTSAKASTDSTGCGRASTGRTSSTRSTIRPPRPRGRPSFARRSGAGSGTRGPPARRSTNRRPRRSRPASSGRGWSRGGLRLGLAP